MFHRSSPGSPNQSTTISLKCIDGSIFSDHRNFEAERGTLRIKSLDLHEICRFGPSFSVVSLFHSKVSEVRNEAIYSFETGNARPFIT